MRNDEPPRSPSRSVRDHPAPLGDLTEIFGRRKIAAGVDSSGQLVLVRPDSLLAKVMDDAQRESVIKYVEHYDKRQADEIRGRARESDLPFVTVRLADVAREDLDGESRWTVSRVEAARRELAALDPNVESEFNHVLFGEQVVKGNPLGAPATWAGDMAFLGRVVETKPDDEGVVQKVLLSTAEPAEQPRVLRERMDIDGRRRPQILVLDTGLRTVLQERSNSRRPEHPRLEACKVHPNWRDPKPGADGRFPVDDEDEPDDDQTGTLDFEGGHGTFIAGVVAQICPDADIHISGVLSSFGDGDVSEVIAGLQLGLAAAGDVDIVVMSFGAFFADDDPGVFGETLTQLIKGKLGIAAAGNQATCRPYFPAGLPEVKGVGAVSAAGRAWFSNWGGWVDACAPGVDVVSTFLDFSEDLGRFPDEEVEGEKLKPRVYKGWARWSGTSFSAPKVAAVLAQEMYLNNISAEEAWRRLTTHDRLRMPDLGVVFNA